MPETTHTPIALRLLLNLNADQLYTETVPMAQSIYENEEFFTKYRELRMNDVGLNGAVEVPAMRAQLPDLVGLRILDLGCGFGHFARYACEQGALHVRAVDSSSRMLTDAQRLTNDERIEYVHGSLEQLAEGKGSRDLVVSSLTIHYVEDFSALAHCIFNILVPGARFVFSVEHPCCTANPIGWIKNELAEDLYWPLDKYQEEGERRTKWFVDGVVKYHRTIETYVNVLVQTGFQILHLGEPKPIISSNEVSPDLTNARRRPPILLLSAQKPEHHLPQS